MADKIENLKESLEGFVKTYEAEQKALRDDITKEQGKTKEDFDKQLNDTVEELKKSINDQIDAIKKNNASIEGLDDDKDKDRFSYAKTFLAMGTGEWKNASFEQDILRQTREKAIDTNSGASGGFLIPVELMLQDIIMPAIAATTMKRLGARFMEGLTGDVDIPEATSRPVLNWGPDGAAATAQNITFALQPLRPKEGNMLVKMSNKLLMQTAVAETFVRQLMQEGITLGIDEKAITGSGSDSEPLGILNVSGTNTTDISSARMTIDDVAGMTEDVEEQNFLKQGGGALLTRPKVKGGLRRERVAQYSGDTGGMPIVVPIMSDQALKDLTGVDIVTSTNVTEASNLTSAVLGEWVNFLIGLWGGARLKTSDQAGDSFVSNQTWIVAFVDMDSRATHPLAFDIASNVKTNF